MKQKRLGNGKIIVANFCGLHQSDFGEVYRETGEIRFKDQVFLVSPDGRYYVNSRDENAEFLSGLFELLVQEKKKTLLECKEIFQKRFPNIRSFDDLDKMQGTKEELTYALAMLIIPIELKRREIETNYY